jgi:crotonobetainyl-CoA:carnitine CoA-transferase CaiB-like acyl-CoA transferase
MIGGALNTAAEQVVEFSAYGHLLTSAGNASPLAEQTVVRCAGDDQWIAITMPDPEARQAVAEAIGGSDAETLADWCRSRPAEEIEALGVELGVPVARVAWPHEVVSYEQLVARGFFEQLEHPVVGTHPYISFPVRFSDGPHRWNRRPAPTLGGDNDWLLRELGYDDDSIERLAADGVIATAVASDQRGW